MSDAHTLERVVADELQHSVCQTYDLHQDALQRLCSGLRVLHMTVSGAVHPYCNLFHSRTVLLCM